MTKKIKVRVFPKSGREEVIKSGERYNVYLKKAAEDGKANKELVGFLKKYFGGRIEIVRGFTSRDKILEVGDGN